MKRLVSLVLAILMLCCVVNAQAASNTSAKLAAPGYCGSSAGSPSSLYVYWDEVAGATSYEVYRQKDGGSWKKLATIKPIEKDYDWVPTYYYDSAVTIASTYTYKVRALKGASKSDFTQSDSRIFVPGPRVTALSTETKGKVTIQWQKLSSKITGISVIIEDEFGNFYDSVYLKASATSYTLKCKSGEKYTIYVEAYIIKDNRYYYSDGSRISVIAK